MSSFLHFLGRTTAQLFLPYQSLFEPISTILNAAQDRQKELVVKWKDTTLYELNFIGIVVSVVLNLKIGTKSRNPNFLSPTTPSRLARVELVSTKS